MHDAGWVLEFEGPPNSACHSSSSRCGCARHVSGITLSLGSPDWALLWHYSRRICRQLLCELECNARALLLGIVCRDADEA